jgi:hypothetical protein
MKIDSILLILCVISIVVIIKNVLASKIEKLDLIDTSDNNPLIRGVRDMKSGFDKLGDFVKMLDGGAQRVLGDIKNAFDPKPVVKDGCPDGWRDDGTVCWLDSYGRGSGRGMDRAPCPNGWRDDGTSCWEDWKCNTWWDGCASRAPWWLGGGCVGGSKTECGGCGCIKKTAMERDSCRSDEDRDGVLCYPKCRPGYHSVGCCLCEPDGGVKRIELDARTRCPYDKHTKKVGVLCYVP